MEEMGAVKTVNGSTMNKAILKITFVLLLFMVGCCNAFVKSKSIRIPPYIIEYYHYDDPEKPTRDEKRSKGWYEHKWDDGFQMYFKIARVEESGVYFYRLLCRVNNTMQKKVTLFDQNIELVDIDASSPIERIKCWNWQKVSYPCNVVEIDPQKEITKEIRFGYSIDEKYTRSLRVLISSLSFEKGEVTIDFYAVN